MSEHALVVDAVPRGLHGRLAVLIIAGALLTGCGNETPPSPALPPSAAPLLSAVVEMRDVDLTWSAEAVIEAVRQSTVAAQIAGRIVEMRRDVGDSFRQGDVLVRIDERAAAQAVVAGEAQVAEAQAAMANARQQFERSRQLLARNFISAAAHDRAEAEYKGAQARVASLVAGAGQASTARSFATIVAPFNGVVSARHAEPGEMATPGRPLLTGFEPGTLRVVATVPQARLGAFQAHGKARIEVPSLNRWLDAKRITLLPAADPGTHTATVRLDLPDSPRDLLPGMFARAYFATGKASLLMVPRAAVIRRSEVTAVYVLRDKAVPELRQVRLGMAADERGIEVLAGVRPGERVALEPVKAGMALAPQR